MGIQAGRVPYKDNQFMKCFHPQTYNDNVVSCGRCPACRQNRINGWVVRLEKHVKYVGHAHFITLTYGDGQCSKTPNGFLTLDKNHLTQFFKRLRNLTNKQYAETQREFKKRPRSGITIVKPRKIQYYVAGEYGSKGLRPHYHIIMFGASIDLISAAWSSKDKQGKWNSRGNIHTGDTLRGSIRYSLKYISKPSRIPLFSGDDRTPEFSNMSKGIGSGYINERTLRWHREDIINRYYVPTNGGGKMTMPRYYADQIYTKEEKAEIGIHLEMKTKDEFYKNLLKDTNFLKNYLTSIKWQEQKAFIPKVTKL